jgi:16S rRNA (guanine527-N7)-methyltransferase
MLGSGALLKDAPERLRRRARRHGLTPSADQVRSLVAYLDLLDRWNRKINLTALDAPDQAIDRLLLEPLIAARQLPADQAFRLMDIGSGGGSPAIPLKVMRPGSSLVMVEAKTRKAAFLREAVRHLNLDQTRVEVCRFEELLTRPDLHEAADFVSLRAVRAEGKTLMNLQAFLKPGGRLLMFRGPSGADVPPMLSAPLEWLYTTPLVESLQSRLVILQKTP